jgi:predicted dehydrogenase
MKGVKLRYGMVGGDLNAFIGKVHRNAIAIEETAVLSAGCFSSNEVKNVQCGKHYDLDSERVYKDYVEMAEKEAQREDKIHFVTIVTPNATHYDVAKTFLTYGFHIVCEKPLCFTIEQAEELESLAKAKDLIFAVTYSYSGYGMVKQARKLVQDGYIGEVVNVNAEYLQEWLIDEIGTGNESTQKLSVWRMDPKKTGISNCVGDIGTHIENTVAYITGLKPVKVAAALDTFGLELDVNANMLVEFSNGAHGVFSCSQVCIGHANGLVVRIFGTEGAIEWKQEDPNYLFVTKKGQPMQIFNRGMGYIEGRAALLNRIPPGHPEGLFIAFANVYRSIMEVILKKEKGEEILPSDMDFPSVSDGVEGVKFIHAVVKSSKNNCVWTEL